ncbi:hypothetical protein WJX75_009272 [Coccomyxa subellipsoidea]|uniref:NAD(P)-binding protein n=1 Tax=Coccomyxa subellipsoidea TaxID=248742 RepID=A0ABR2YIF2_9CHLO
MNTFANIPCTAVLGKKRRSLTAVPSATPIIPDLKDKRVLVTDGLLGIGKAVAFAFDANGCSVAILGSDSDLHRLDDVARQMKYGVVVVADLTKEADANKAVKDAVQMLGGLDILVNCGGAPTGIDGTDQAVFMAEFKLHVTGTLTLIRAAETELIKNKGAIINVSSAAANIPGDSFTAYDMVKAAEDKLTKDLAFQYAPQGVRVNCVLPGVINTELCDDMAELKGLGKKDMMAALAAKHPLGHVSEP